MGKWTLVKPLFWPWRPSIIRGHPLPRSLQGALSAFQGQSYEGHNLELMRTIDELSNATRWWYWDLKLPISFLRDHIPFGFGTMISLDAKTCSVPQFIGAPQWNFETADLGIKSLAPLALGGWVNLLTPFIWPQRPSIIHHHPISKSL